MSAISQFSTTILQDRRSSVERQLLHEHALWVAQAARCASEDTAQDLLVLSKGLQRMAEDARRRDLPQVLRAEIMDVLHRCGESDDGVEPLSMIRAARSLVQCVAAQTRSDASVDRDLLLDTIKTLEKRIRQKDEIIARLERGGATAAAREMAPPNPLLRVDRSPSEKSWIERVMSALLPSRNKSFQNTVFSDEAARALDESAERLKTVVLTVQGQANAKSLYEVTSDWSMEKIRAKRVARAWAAGQLHESPMAEASSDACRFGQWLALVDPPSHLRSFVDDLRMWHSHWHALATEWSRTDSIEAKRQFARGVVHGDTNNQFVYCSRRIDSLMGEMARVATQGVALSAPAQ